MPKSYLDFLRERGVRFYETPDMMKYCSKLDILYVTRIQQERFPDPLEYEKLKGVYRLDSSLLPHIKRDMKIMHPLPRVDEISPELDKTGHALYFEQAANGIPVRKAILALVLGAVK